MTELVERVNAKRKGPGRDRTLTTHDHQALCWKEHLRDNPRMAWKHSYGATHVWSGDAVRYMVDLTDAQFEVIRREYREHLRAKKAAPKG